MQSVIKTANITILMANKKDPEDKHIYEIKNMSHKVILIFSNNATVKGSDKIKCASGNYF